MIRIGRLTDYGLMVMTHFVRQQDRWVLNGRELADELRLPLPTVSKILKLLAQAQLLVAQRGANGGYRLQRDPRQISVGAVIRALEGPIAITLCSLDENCNCEVELSCQVRGNWQRINEAIFALLDSISIAQMSEPLPDNMVMQGTLGLLQPVWRKRDDGREFVAAASGPGRISEEDAE